VWLCRGSVRWLLNDSWGFVGGSLVRRFVPFDLWKAVRMAPPPSHDTVVAALSALRGDAAVWYGDAGEMRAGSRAVAALTLDDAAFSGLGETIGYTAVYRRLVAKVGALFDGAAANFDAVGAALTAAADAYEQDERDAVHLMKGAW
jgi:hypothetical protein